MHRLQTFLTNVFVRKYTARCENAAWMVEIISLSNSFSFQNYRTASCHGSTLILSCISWNKLSNYPHCRNFKIFFSLSRNFDRVKNSSLVNGLHCLALSCKLRLFDILLEMFIPAKIAFRNHIDIYSDKKAQNCCKPFQKLDMGMMIL